MPWYKPKIDTGMFKEERVGRLHKTKGVIYALLTAFLVISGFWFMLYSDFFKITKIEISPLSVLGEGAVRGEIEAYFNRPKQWPWGNRNIFFIKPDDLKNYLKKKFFVQEVTVDKTFPNILRLKIQERQRSVILIAKNAMYIVDDYGVVTDIADDNLVSSTIRTLSSPQPIEATKEVLIITSATDTYAVGQAYTGSQNVRQWLDTANKLRDAGIWFKAMDIGLDPAEDVKIILKENKDVIMALDEPLDGQIETLRQFLATKPNLDDIHDYIDVRVPGKVYYK